MNITESVSARKASAAALLASLAATHEHRARAKATQAALNGLPTDLAANNIDGHIAKAKRDRDAQRIHSPAWIAADARYDVLVGIEEDINPTELAEMGVGSNPTPVAETAAPGETAAPAEAS